MKRETKTRYVGTCPICEREQRLDGQRNMVHHGYRRPGHGTIQGDCWGVGRTAYELSCEATKEYRDTVIEPLLEASFTYLTKLRSGEIKVLHRRSFLRSDETREVREGDPFFKAILEREISTLKNRVDAFCVEVKRLTRLIDAWKPRSVRTLNEEVVEARSREKREERQRALQAKREAKLADAVARYQKRIDSAVRNRTTSVIADVFENAPRKLPHWSRLTHVEALKLLQRDHVWEAFGLTKDGQVTPEAKQILGQMSYPEFHGMARRGYPWPDALV